MIPVEAFEALMFVVGSSRDESTQYHFTAPGSLVEVTIPTRWAGHRCIAKMSSPALSSSGMRRVSHGRKSITHCFRVN